MKALLRRPWFWVSLCLVILAGVGWSYLDAWLGEREWQAYVASARARGVKVFPSDVVLPALPDEENAAAMPLWMMARQSPQTFEQNFPALTEVWYPRLSSEKQRPQLATWRQKLLQKNWLPPGDTGGSDAEAVLRALQCYAPLFAELRAAALRPAAQLPVNWEGAFYDPDPNFGPGWRMRDPLILKFECHLALGQGAEALADWKDVVTVARLMAGSPTLWGCLETALYRQSAAMLLAEALEDHLWSADQIGEVEVILASWHPFAELQTAYAVDRAYVTHLVEKAAVDKDIGPYIGEVREWNLTELGNIPTRAAFQLQACRSRWWRTAQIELNQDYDDLARYWEADGLPCLAADLSSHAFFKSHVPGPLQLISCRDFSCYPKQSLKSLATIRMAQTACALARFQQARGRYPAQLSELAPAFIPALPVDPCTGKALCYRLQSPGHYLLYSAGLNQQDEGGDPGDPHAGDSPDWLWLVRPPAP